jgi:cobalt-zinc-cadmium efflux system outer membrane protein
VTGPAGRAALRIAARAALLGMGGLVAAGSVAAQQAQTSLTLAAALDMAARANPTIAAARLRHPVDVAGVHVAGEWLNPELTYDLERETPRQAITGVFPIELGGKRRRRIDLATAGVASGDADLEQIVADVRNRVRRAYFTLLAAQERVALAGDLRALAIRANDAAEARVNAGDAPRLEALQTQLALAAVENEVTAAEGDVRAASADLDALIGRPAGTPVFVTGDLSAGTVPALGDALARAAGSNTALVALDRRIDEQLARRELARAMQVPDLAAGTSVTYDAQPEFQVGWRFSVTMAIPVFTRHRAGVELESAEVDRLHAERAALAADIAATVAAALARADALRQQLDHYRTEIFPRAQLVENMAQEGYQAGQTGVVTLIQSLQAAREIRARGLQAGLDFQLALADLERAIGAANR